MEFITQQLRKLISYCCANVVLASQEFTVEDERPGDPKRKTLPGGWFRLRVIDPVERARAVRTESEKAILAFLRENRGCSRSVLRRGIKGKAAHSSSPGQGLSAIEGAQEFLNRLAKLQLPGSHPFLGGRHAIAFQIVYEPVAPHTLPEIARIRVDRRLLPGDDVDQAVAEVREAIGDLAPYEVTITRGTHMRPALIDPQHHGVQALTEAHRRVYSQDPETYYGQGSFDAGGPSAAGVPTVMYGVGGGASVLEEDFAPVRQVVDEARVLTHTIMSLLG